MTMLRPRSTECGHDDRTPRTQLQYISMFHGRHVGIWHDQGWRPTQITTLVRSTGRCFSTLRQWEFPTWVSLSENRIDCRDDKTLTPQTRR